MNTGTRMTFKGVDSSGILKTGREYYVLMIPRVMVTTKDGVRIDRDHFDNRYFFYVCDIEEDSFPIRIEYFSYESISNDWGIEEYVLHVFFSKRNTNEYKATHSKDSRIGKLVRVNILGDQKYSDEMMDLYREYISKGYMVYMPHFVERDVFVQKYDPCNKSDALADEKIDEYLRRIIYNADYTIICAGSEKEIGSTVYEKIISSGTFYTNKWVGFSENISFVDNDTMYIEALNSEYKDPGVPRIIRKF